MASRFTSSALGVSVRRREDQPDPWVASNIKDHASYQGEMGPRDAATKLREHSSSSNCYITRYYHYDYMVSVRDVESDEIQHFKIKKKEKGGNELKFKIKGANDDELFNTVPSLLEYYKDKPVFLKGPKFGQCLKCVGSLTRQATEDKSDAWEYSRLKSHASYHGDMGPRDAAARLKGHAGGTCYLTRYNWGDYMISVKNKDSNEVQHFKLKSDTVREEYKFSVKGADDAMEFDCVPELLDYYKDRPISRDVMIGDCLEPEINYAHTAPKLLNDMTYPSLANLFMMKWTDEEGKVQRLRIIQELSPQWREVAILFGFSWAELEEIETSSQMDSTKCMQLVFKDWVGGKHTRSYSRTWGGLYELMQDIEFEHLAEKMKVVLASKDIIV